MTKELATCKQCGKEFSYYRSTLRGKDGQYCSRKCFLSSGKEPWNKGMIEYKKCLCCGKKIRSWRKYCSKKCHYEMVDMSERLPKDVSGKDNPFFGKKHTQESKEKMSLAQKSNPTRFWLNKKRPEMSGSNHPNWNGGTSNMERGLFYQTVRKRVLERDDYTCQLCGKRGGKLHVDHIQSWKDFVDQRFNIDNCRTLCMNCHYKLTFGREIPANVKSWGMGFGKAHFPLELGEN